MATKRRAPALDRAAELRRLYDALNKKLADASGSGAAAIVLQMRNLTREIEQIQAVEVSKADELAARRSTKARAARPPARRRQSRGG